MTITTLKHEYDLFQNFQILMTIANKVQSFKILSAGAVIPSALFFSLNNFYQSSIHLNKERLFLTVTQKMCQSTA